MTTLADERDDAGPLAEDDDREQHPTTAYAAPIGETTATGPSSSAR